MILGIAFQKHKNKVNNFVPNLQWLIIVFEGSLKSIIMFIKLCINLLFILI